MKKITDLFFDLLSKTLGKKFTYVSNNYRKNTNLAVKSSYGFWYCGDVFNQSDIAYGIASNGSVEIFDTKTVVSILKDLRSDYVFYDIGSNTGWYSMIASAVSSTSRVYSFEPLIEHIECQRATISLNNKNSQIELFETALSNRNGKESIKLAGSGSSLESNFLKKHSGLREINIQTLDSIVKENNLPYPDFIKIDTEGHEYKILQGAKNILEKSKPILFIEIAYSLRNIGRDFINKDFDKLFSELRNYGYTSFILKDDRIEEFKTEQKFDGVYMFLFVHKSSK